MTDVDAIVAGLSEALGAFDKTGRQIMVGDVLKVYHFRGARWRKDYFMFKQVVGTRVLGKSGDEYLLVSHLNMKPADGPDGGYHLAQDGTHHSDIEIVQGLDWHHDRPRLAVRAKLEAGNGA